jgi:AAA domain
VAITQLHIQHLGGIPRELELAFTKDGRAASVVLYGDNGTGKSSIVDAIEFVLQARVRRADRPQELLKTVRSLAADQLPLVRAVLDCGEVVERGFADEKHGGVSIEQPEPCPAFTVAPVALRRTDVTRFWDTAEDHRQVLFRAFFRDPEQGSWMRLDEGDERRLREQRSRLKTERRALLDVVLRPLDAIPSQVPLESPEAFDGFIERSFPETFGRNWPRSGPTADDEQDIARFEAAVKGRRLTQEILDVQRKLRKAKAASVGQTALAEVLTSATAELGAAFNEISDVTFVDAVDLTRSSPQ